MFQCKPVTHVLNISNTTILFEDFPPCKFSFSQRLFSRFQCFGLLSACISLLGTYSETSRGCLTQFSEGVGNLTSAEKD